MKKQRIFIILAATGVLLAGCGDIYSKSEISMPETSYSSETRYWNVNSIGCAQYNTPESWTEEETDEENKKSYQSSDKNISASFEIYDEDVKKIREDAFAEKNEPLTAKMLKAASDANMQESNWYMSELVTIDDKDALSRCYYTTNESGEEERFTEYLVPLDGVSVFKFTFTEHNPKDGDSRPTAGSIAESIHFNKDN